MADRGDETTTGPNGSQAGGLFGGASLRDALRAVAGLREPTTRADAPPDARAPMHEPTPMPTPHPHVQSRPTASVTPRPPSDAPSNTMLEAHDNAPSFLDVPAEQPAATPDPTFSPTAEVFAQAPDMVAPASPEPRDIADVLGVAPSPISMQPQRVPATTGQTKLLRSDEQILDLAASPHAEAVNDYAEAAEAEIDPARRLAEASIGQPPLEIAPVADVALPEVAETIAADETFEPTNSHAAPFHALAEPSTMGQNPDAYGVLPTSDAGDAPDTTAATIPAEAPALETDLPAAAAVAVAESERDMTVDEENADQTRLVRGVQKPGRDDYFQEPVVAWLVVIGGPGLGAFRPVYEGNNALGRAPTQRIAIDFGDDAISAEEQAYIRYDSTDRTFLFVPNLAKTNVVSLNETKPTSAVPLTPMDVITVGKTQLVFVPFCGPEFDWSELKAIGSAGA
ncbi:MAG: hypothetical protein AAGJ70_02925 [Pseudomonadota bacterium]